MTMMLAFDPSYLGKYGIHCADKADIAGYFCDAGQPTVHYNVLKYSGEDNRLIRVDERSALWFIKQAEAPEKLPRYELIVSERDIYNRLEQNRLLYRTLLHFGYPVANLGYTYMEGFGHCGYVGKQKEDGSWLFAQMIRNFIEKKPLPEKKTAEKQYVAFASRLSKEKGVTILAEVAKLLPEYSCVVAGNGPDDEDLKDIPNVTMKGFLSGDELTSLIANAKVMILPSVWYENCPLNILETHAFGVPVITMDSGGMAEIVVDGKTGLLIKEPTAQAIKDAIKKCFEDEEFYRSIKENSQKRGEEIIEVGAYCDVLVSKYQELLNKR